MEKVKSIIMAEKCRVDRIEEIYLNKNTEFDKLAINELYKHYKDVIIIDSEFDEPMLSEYDMLTKAMYLTKYIAEQKEKDLSGVDYSPMTKKFYKYNGNI